MTKPKKARHMPNKSPQNLTERDRFVAAANAANVDEDEKRWEARLKAVVKPPAKPAKKGK